MTKIRLDDLLLSMGSVDSREKAQALILAGRVSVDGRRASKAGERVESGSPVTIAGKPHPYVSRGGVKLEAALAAFAFVPLGKIALDVGASTGGFTDCFLRHGAARVYAVDTGYGQIDARLRADPRVVLYERTNARDLDPSMIPDSIGIAAIDVSFTSARRVLPAVAALLQCNAPAVVLVKPQFEARREEVKRGGLVKDPAIHARVVQEITDAARELGLDRTGVRPSPISGAHGNAEFLLGFVKGC